MKLKIWLGRIIPLVIIALGEIVLYCNLFKWLTTSFVFIEIVLHILSILIVLNIVRTSRHLSSDLMWIILIMLFPVFGTFVYVLMLLSLLFGKTFRNIIKEQKKASSYYIQDESIIDEIRNDNPDYVSQLAFLHEEGFPIYRNTDFEYYAPCENGFNVMLEELKKAENYIFMEYFIISEGYLWDTVLEILKEKAAAGVDVRVIYDDFGCVTTLPYQYYKSLQQMGIKCAAFNQFRPVLNVILNNRDHRKIAVIDGHTAFTGGINLADEYINRKERFGHWKDSGICLHGEAVWSFTVMFLQMWSTITGMECNFESYRPEIYHEEAFKKDGFVQPYGDSPLDGETVGEHVYLNIISQAKKYLYIFTPYLIPDNETLTALCMAAKRGVDVRIVTPGIPDKKIVYILTQANYEILLESGVQIYQYTPGFIHSKSFVCDDEVATVGTINMDYRSMYLHFECGVWMYGSSAVAQVKEDALTTFEQCEQINMDYCRKKNFAVRALRGALKFLAPLL